MATLQDGESALVTIQPSYALKLAPQSGTVFVTEVTAEGGALTPEPYTVNPTWLGPFTTTKTYLLAAVGGITNYDSGVINYSFMSRRVIAQNNVAVASTNTTAEELLATVVIPGGTIGANGIIRCLAFWTVTNNTNVKSARIRLGGFGGTIYHLLSLASSSSGQALCIIRNTGVVDAQNGMNSAALPFGTTSSGIVISAYDTTKDLEVAFTSEKATGTDIMALRGYSVEVSPDFT